MNAEDVKQLFAWLIGRGLAGASETDLLHGFCERCCQAGLPLSRGTALVDTLHPIYEGRAFRWRNDGVEESAVLEYGSSNEGEGAEAWLTSTFYHMVTNDETELRRDVVRVRVDPIWREQPPRADPAKHAGQPSASLQGVLQAPVR